MPTRVGGARHARRRRPTEDSMFTRVVGAPHFNMSTFDKERHLPHVVGARMFLEQDAQPRTQFSLHRRRSTEAALPTRVGSAPHFNVATFDKERHASHVGGTRTLVMGILNVTPDSFSDGGRWLNVESAVKHAREMIEDGADIIDIGAESTRPDATPIDAAEEINRLEKILSALKNCPVPISVDTYKPTVAQAALELGADFINAVHVDRAMLECSARNDCPLVVTHDRPSDDVISDIKNFFDRIIEQSIEIGLERSNLIFDPGIGFGKTQEQNLMILHRLEELSDYRPLLLGVSRKSVIGYALNLPIESRDEVTGIWSVIGAMRGADIIRVHNVKMIVPMLRAADVLK